MKKEFSRLISLEQLFENDYESEKFTYNKDIEYYLIGCEGTAFAHITHILEPDMHNGAVVVAIDDCGHDLVICWDTKDKFIEHYCYEEGDSFKSICIGVKNEVFNELEKYILNFLEIIVLTIQVWQKKSID